MKKLIFLSILVLSFALLFTSCDALNSLLGEGEDETAYNGEFADAYNALKEAGYGGTPEDFVRELKARMEWHGYSENDKEFDYEIVDGELILTFPDGKKINCGTVVYESGAEMVRVSLYYEMYPSVLIPRDGAIGTLPELSREGYTFGGWFKIEDYNNGIYDNEILADTKISENITLAPRWIKNVTDNGNRPAELVAVYKNDRPLEEYYPRIHISEFNYNNLIFYFAYDEDISSYEISIDGENCTLDEKELIRAPGWQDAVSAIRVKITPSEVGIYTLRAKVTDKDGNKTESEASLYVFDSQFLPPPYGMADFVGVSTAAGGSENFEEITLIQGEKQKLYFTFFGNIEGLDLTYNENKVNTYKVGNYLVAEFEVVCETIKDIEHITLEAVQTVNGRVLTHSYGYEVTVGFDTDLKVTDARIESSPENIYYDGKINLKAGYYGMLYVHFNAEMFKVLYESVSNDVIECQFYDTGYNTMEVDVRRTDVGECVIPVKLIVVAESDGGHEYSDEIEVEIVVSVTTIEEEDDESNENENAPQPSRYKIFDITAEGATYDKDGRTLRLDGEGAKLEKIHVGYSSPTQVVKKAYIDGREVVVDGCSLDNAGIMYHGIVAELFSPGVYQLKLVLVNSQEDVVTIIITDPKESGNTSIGLKWSDVDGYTSLSDREITYGKNPTLQIQYNAGYQLSNATSDTLDLKFHERSGDDVYDAKVYYYSFCVFAADVGTHEIILTYNKTGEDVTTTVRVKINVVLEDKDFFGMANEYDNFPNENYTVVSVTGGKFRIFFSKEMYGVKVEFLGKTIIPGEPFTIGPYVVYEIVISEGVNSTNAEFKISYYTDAAMTDYKEVSWQAEVK